MDWITLAVEAIGIVIFLFWFVVPIREFSEIFKRLKHKPVAPDAAPKEGGQ